MTRSIRYWLALCAALVFAMVVVGGLTRLTESGLSIVEWKPISGTLPPMTQDAWNQEFTAYQSSPQFKTVNHAMGLEEFKGIFWLEYIHRLLGRIIGLAFILPLIFFYAKKQVSGRFALKMLGIFALGGLQGAVGWYMVKSGLVADPHVSPYRLMFHLGLGVIIFGWLVWEFLNSHSVTSGNEESRSPLRGEGLGFPLCSITPFLPLLIFLQILLGALVAGNDAGLVYNTFPTMNGAWIPDGMMTLTPWWHNLFENVTTVQFMHRIGAYGLILVIPIFWIVAKKHATNAATKRRLNVLLIVLAFQLCLGVLTLLHQAPIALASLHQAAALVLFGASLSVLHSLNQK